MTLLSFRGRLPAAIAVRAALWLGLAAISTFRGWADSPTARPAWTIPYGAEFWKTPTPKPQPTLLSATSGDLDQVVPNDVAAGIDRVQHAFRRSGQTESWDVSSRTYFSEITGTGLEFRTPSGSVAEVGIKATTRTLRVGSLVNAARKTADWVIAGNTAQRLNPGPIPFVEHLEARSGGVEVTWILPEAPMVVGDLAIDWEITGPAPEMNSFGGWRFPGAGSDASVIVGEAVAVDATGQRLVLRSHATSHGLAIVVPAKFLRSAVYPMAIDPLISTEFDLDEPVTTAAPSAQFAPAIASDGTNHLVVWHDNRNGSGLDLYAARVTTNGTVLDPSGFAITTATNDQWFPAVAYNGTNYLVAWQDARGGNQDIYAARVTPDGRVVETNGLAIVTAANDQRFPAVAALDGGYLIAWQDGRNGAANQDIYAARVHGGGTLVETNGFVVSNAANSQSAPAVGVVGANYVAAWHDFRSGVSLDAYAARISPAGVLIDANGVIVSAAANDQWNVAVAGNGPVGLIVWQDGRNGTDEDIFGARIDGSGVVLDPTGISISQQPNQQRQPAVHRLGTGFHATWQDSRAGADLNLYGTSVSAEGNVASATGTLISDATNDQRIPAMALAGDQLLVVWEDVRNGAHTDIVGSRVDATGAVLDPGGVIVSTVANAQESPAVAGNGSIYLAVWRDFRLDPLGDIFGSRIGADGTVLDPMGLAICTASNYQLAPRVAASGDDFLVVWQDFRNGVHDDILGARVTDAGMLLDPNGLPVTTAVGAQRLPDVAGGTNGYLVVWQDRRSGSTDDILGARVTREGNVLDAVGLSISSTTSDQTAPAAAALNDGYFVTWEDLRNGGSRRAYGTRVQADGGVSAANGFELSSRPGEQLAPRVAASTNQLLVVWHGGSNSASFDIQGTRVSNSGIVRDTNSLAINSAAGPQSRPTVAAKGGDFMVVWEDQRVAGRTNLYSTRLTANGAILEPEGDLTAPATGRLRAPMIANVGTDYLLVYQTSDAGNVPRGRGVIQYPASQPVISLSPGAAQFIAGSGAVPVDPNAILVDADTAAFEGGTLTIDLIENGTANDRLGIRHQGNGAGQIGINGNQVSYAGTLIGFSSGGTSGSSPLFIIFSSAASADAVEVLARNITFNNVAEQPFTQARKVRFALNLSAGAGLPSTRAVEVIDAGSVPMILTQPIGQSAGAGGEVTLTVVANGSQPLRYQWSLNGVNIAGATNATHTISGLESTDAGAYTVAINNEYDTVVSSAATVTYFDIEMYAGLTIAGPAGANYRVEYRTAFGNDPTWLALTNVILGTEPLLFFDTASNRKNQRFYRAIPGE
jgi:hypothetical protein